MKSKAIWSELDKAAGFFFAGLFFFDGKRVAGFVR